MQGWGKHCAGEGPAASSQAAFRRPGISWAQGASAPLPSGPIEKGSCSACTPKGAFHGDPLDKCRKLGLGGKECDGKSKGADGNAEASALKAGPPTSMSLLFTSCHEDNLVPERSQGSLQAAGVLLEP